MKKIFGCILSQNETSWKVFPKTVLDGTMRIWHQLPISVFQLFHVLLFLTKSYIWNRAFGKRQQLNVAPITRRGHSNLLTNTLKLYLFSRNVAAFVTFCIGLLSLRTTWMKCCYESTVIDSTFLAKLVRLSTCAFRLQLNVVLSFPFSSTASLFFFPVILFSLAFAPSSLEGAESAFLAWTNILTRFLDFGKQHPTKRK